jgi:cysteine-rich repeat protein
MWVQVELTSEVQCGDKFLDLAEKCDDGNQQDGDGCSSRCQVRVNEHAVRGVGMAKQKRISRGRS